METLWTPRKRPTNPLNQVETLPTAVLRDVIATMPSSVILSVSQRQLPAVLAAAVARALRE